MWKFVSNTIIKSLMSICCQERRKTQCHIVSRVVVEGRVLFVLVCDICKSEQMSLGTFVSLKAIDIF